jgi:hypothetical protein
MTAGTEQEIPVLAPREVLDRHAGLAALLRRPSLQLLHLMRLWLGEQQDCPEHGPAQVAGVNGNGMLVCGHRTADADRRRFFWPFHQLPPNQAAPALIAAMAGDLADARTYQVVPQMVQLASAVYRQQHEGGQQMLPLEQAELPCESGFAWLDVPFDAFMPWAGAGEGGDMGIGMATRAVSWSVIPMPGRGEGRGVRITDWGYDEECSLGGTMLWPKVPVVLPFGPRAIGAADHGPWLAVVLWALFGMEITATERGQLDRHAVRRAARSLDRQEVTVVRLRRARHEDHPGHEPRHVDWSCTWLVRGHTRHYNRVLKTGPNAGRTSAWVRPYIKGPDGAPLCIADVLYRLQR